MKSYYLNLYTKEIVTGKENSKTTDIGPFSHRLCIEVRERVLHLNACMRNINIGDRESVINLIDAASRYAALLLAEVKNEN